MIPPTPVPFVAAGAVWYGELFCGLYRALAAPWLDPWWLARAMRTERKYPPQAAVVAPRPPSSQPAAEPPGDVATSQAKIISLDRARARAAASRAAGATKPRR